MPMTKGGGWLLDDSPMFTDEQWAEIKALLDQGKVEEAQKMIDEIIKEKNEQTNG